MESRGYVLRYVRFGCLLYFDCCKPHKNVLYYLTQTVKHLGNEEELNRKSLVNERNGRVRSRSEFALLKLCGFYSLKFTLYRFTESEDFVSRAKNSKKKEVRLYRLSLVNYIIYNFALIAFVVIMLSVLHRRLSGR